MRPLVQSAKTKDRSCTHVYITQRASCEKNSGSLKPPEAIGTEGYGVERHVSGDWVINGTVNPLTLVNFVCFYQCFVYTEDVGT